LYQSVDNNTDRDIGAGSTSCRYGSGLISVPECRFHYEFDIGLRDKLQLDGIQDDDEFWRDRDDDRYED
jgi:hypothetical protein